MVKIKQSDVSAPLLGLRPICKNDFHETGFVLFLVGSLHTCTCPISYCMSKMNAAKTVDKYFFFCTVFYILFLGQIF